MKRGSDVSVILVTGATKGIGRATAALLSANGHEVWLGARDARRGEAAAKATGTRFVLMDVTDDDSVAAALATIEKSGSGLDVLINNAGIGIAENDGVTGANALLEFDTNAVSVVRVTQAALPLLRRSVNPVVTNLSSGLGSFSSNTDPSQSQSHTKGAYLVYAATKAAVGMLTLQYSKAVPEVKFNAVEPGYTATDLTGNDTGAQPVEHAAEVVARWATIGPDGPTGTFQGEDAVWPW